VPLNLAALTSSPGLPGAGERDYPHTRQLAAHEWAAAAGAWAAGIVPPSTTVAAAQTALESALDGAFTLANPAPAIDAAFATFAATLAVGMLPLYTGTPPPAPLGIAQLFTVKRTTRQAGVAAVAARLDAWMRTGIAVLVAPPKTALPWA
jgi:hypothetical protein